MIGKFFYMIRKDLLMFFRDIKNFSLLFITPIFITILIGSVFLSSQPYNVPIIVCAENEQNELYQNMISMIGNTDIFSLQTKEGNCEEVIGNALQTSSAVAGIIIPDVPDMNISENYEVNIRIIYDNTKPIGFFIRSYFGLVSHDISKRVISSAIDSLIADVDSLSSQMEKVEIEIKNQINSLSYLQENIIELSNNLEQIKSGIIGINNEIDKLSQGIMELSYVYNQMDDISKDIDSLRNVIISMNQTGMDPVNVLYLQQIEAEIDNIQVQVENAKDQVLYARSGMQEFYNVLYQKNLNSIINSISSTQNALTSTANEIGNIRKLMQSSLNEIMQTKDYVIFIIKNVPYDIDPIKTQIEGYFGDQSYIHFIFPSIIIMILLWFGTFLSSVSFIRQKYTGVLKRISVSPTSSLFIIIERMFVYSIITMICVPLLIIAGVLFLGVQLSALNAIMLIIISFFSSFIFVSMGLIIAAFSKTESTAIMVSMMVIFPFIFLAGVFFPTESFPVFLKYFVEFLPVVFPIKLAQSMIFYKINMLYILTTIAYILMYIVAFALTAWFILKKNMKS